MSSSEIISQTDDAVLTVTLNRPRKYNAINTEMLEGLHAAFNQFKRDDNLRVLLIRANGEYFSSGLDVTTLGGTPFNSPSHFRTAYSQKARHWLWDEFESVEKPIVVAHAGPCLGAALEMSLSCDFRLASVRAAYGLPEFAMGMIPGSGGTSRLTRLIGPHWARWLIMAGKRIDAERALAVGLVHQVSSEETFEADVHTFCQGLANQPPETMAAAKLAIELTRDLDRTQARNVERLVNSSLAGGEEQRRLFEVFQARFERKREVPPPSELVDEQARKRKSSNHAADQTNDGSNFGSVVMIETKLRNAFTTLTEPERQVTARVLYGMTPLDIANDLKLTEETVATYHRRAFQRLEVGSHDELIKMFLGLDT
jgi:enoyl-CoA hydratase/carnithine racemase/DNA-binding CsgD family transcriptional regulator